MGRHLELSHLTEEECERILQVIQRDFDLRQKEKSRLNKIEEEIKEEDTKVAVLGKQKNFNENCCMRCFARFFFIFNQKVQCMQCQYFICKNCSSYVSEKKMYVCNICSKQKELQTQSFDWFYTNMKNRFKRFGSAKVVRSLYKRKTDSDSENDSGYDPSQYSNSLPVGKRSRQTIEGFFSDLMTKQLNPSELVSQISEPNEDQFQEGENDNDVIVEHNDVITECADVIHQLGLSSPTSNYQTPYTCNVGTGLDTYEAVKEQEVQRFRHDLNHIVNDVHRTLETQSLDAQHVTDIISQHGHLLGSQKLHISTALSNLSQSLHIAVDNQQLLDSSNAAAHHNSVQDTIVKEVEDYVGHPITLSNNATASNASNIQSLSKDHEETLADAIVQKILNDWKLTDDRRHEREEAKVMRDLTKLSNQCTLRQLQDQMTDTDTEENLNSSTYLETDTESHLSEQQELLQLDTMTTSTPRNDVTSHPPDVRHNDTGQDSDIDLDELVARNSYRKSESRGDDVTCITVTSPDGDTMSLTEDPLTVRRKVRNDTGSDGGESDGTIEADSDTETTHGSPVIEPIIRRSQVVTEYVEPLFEDDDDDVISGGRTYDDALYYAGTDRKIPLPSFEDTASSIGIEEVDLDDISRHDEEDDFNNTIESEILFCRSWDVSQPGPLFKDRISAYDNFGERKVGRDDQGPVFMLVPDGENDLQPKVGEQDVSELSDLSENDDSNSDSLSDTDSDENNDVERPPRAVRRRKKSKDVLKVTSDFAVQTDDLDSQEVVVESVSVMAEANVQHEYLTLSTPTTPLSPKEKLELYRKKKFEEEEPAEETAEDSEDADPRFVLRPQSVTSPIGDPVRFTCQVTGTSPLDVFWYKEEEGVQQLEDDEHYETRTYENKHILEIYNTQDAHRGQYFCIAVNEKGRNHKTFRLKLTENTSEKAAPEFLKSPQDVEVMEGMSATFRCKVKGYPHPRVTWYKDGKRLHNSDHYTMQKLGNRDYTLRVDAATMDDDAEYTVVARNMVGEARAAGQLLIEIKSDETEKKYADLEEQEKSEPRDLKTDLPKTDELLKIHEEVHSSRSQVANTAENILHSANKYHFDDFDLERSIIHERVSPVNWNALLLSSIHNQIDEMDRKLNNLQDEVTQSILPRSESMTSDDDGYNNNGSSCNISRLLSDSGSSPPIVTNSLRQSILREHDDMRHAAGAVRRVTSTALEVLTTSDTLMKATKDLSPEHTRHENVTNNDAPEKEEESFVIEKENFKDDDREEELHLSYADFELLYKHGKISKEQLKSGKVGRREGESILQTLHELKKYSMEEEAERGEQLSVEGTPTSIDCGLKRVPSKRYKRDYVINRSPTPQRRKWDVKEPRTPTAGAVKGACTAPPDDINDLEDSVYMTAGGVFSLEQRIKHLQGEVDRDDLTEADMGALEDEVARTAAQVTQSERQVSKIEKQVCNLQEQQQGTPVQNIFNFQPETGDSFTANNNNNQSNPSSPFSAGSQTSEHHLVGEEESLELPSVKNLRSLFNKNTDDGQSVRRVHSLTGRDLPRGVRQKLAEQSTNVITSPNVRLQTTGDVKSGDVSSKKRHPLPDTFQSPSSSVDVSQTSLSSPESLSHAMPTSSTPKNNPSEIPGRPITSPSSPILPEQASVISKTSSSVTLRNSQRSSGDRSRQGDEGEKREESFTGVAPKKNRNSAIMARAAFWDQRILEGKASDKEMEQGGYPTLPGENFKSSDEQ